MVCLRGCNDVEIGVLRSWRARARFFFERIECQVKKALEKDQKFVLLGLSYIRVQVFIIENIREIDYLLADTLLDNFDIYLLENKDGWDSWIDKLKREAKISRERILYDLGVDDT